MPKTDGKLRFEHSRTKQRYGKLSACQAFGVPGGGFHTGRGWLWTVYDPTTDSSAEKYPLRAPIAKLLRTAMDFHESAVSAGTVRPGFVLYEYFRMWPVATRDSRLHTTKLGEVYAKSQAAFVADTQKAKK